MTVYASDPTTTTPADTPAVVEPAPPPTAAELAATEPDATEPPLPAEPDEPVEEAEPEAEPEWKQQAEWEHDWIPFHGDLLAFRVPSQSAVSAVGIGAGPGSTSNEQSFYARYFISQHLSPESFQRVIMRSIQPDGYPDGVDPYNDLVSAISKPLLDRLTAEAKEAAEKAKAERNGKR
jgi:hypothetical protein